MTFEIKRFVVEGNTLLSQAVIDGLLRGYTGPLRTIDDVQAAKRALESRYHAGGYPAVLVNIPEQSTEGGTIRLVVTESRVGRVRVTGNRYFTKEKILRDLAALGPGKVLYLPDVQESLNRANRNRDFKVAPVLMPGREPGTIDIELKVKDRLPLHGRVELNNRSTHDTADLRTNVRLSYDNLWQREHSISLQFQTSPQDPQQVQVFVVSYLMPAPWNRDHMVALYGVVSDSDTAFGEGFQVIGKGKLAGARYVVPLPVYKRYDHTLTLGIDYKHFDETLGFAAGAGGEPVKTPITYLPLSLSYNSTLAGAGGLSRFGLGLNLSFRGLVSDQRQFEVKRFRARGNYLYLTASGERLQDLPLDAKLFVHVEGQIADQPLISNEQFSAGGMEDVRGYKESEALGDDALQATVELRSPDLAQLAGLPEPVDVQAYLFGDYAEVRTREPLPEEDPHQELRGAGIGFRGALPKGFEYQVDGAVALADTSRTSAGDVTLHFRAAFVF